MKRLADLSTDLTVIAAVGLGMMAGGLWHDRAWADQAAFLERQEAIRAGNQIDLDQEVRLYCQPCGDQWAESLTITQIGVYPAGYEEYFELWLNDRAVDLAYTYVQQEERWQNLALILDLEVVEVPRILPEDLEILPALLDSGP